MPPEETTENSGASLFDKLQGKLPPSQMIPLLQQLAAAEGAADFTEQIKRADAAVEIEQLGNPIEIIDGSRIRQACNAYARLKQLAQTLGIPGEALAERRPFFNRFLGGAEQEELKRRQAAEGASEALEDALTQFRIAYAACMAIAEAIVPAIQARQREQRRQQAREVNTDFELGPRVRRRLPIATALGTEEPGQ